MADIRWPAASLPLQGTEQVPVLQGGKVVGAPSNSFGGGGPTPPPSGGGLLSFASYNAIRTAADIPDGTTAILLDDPYKGGIFVPAPNPPPQPFMARDNGGTVVVDGKGNAWTRVYDGKINAAWFYSHAGHYLGDGGSNFQGTIAGNQLTVTTFGATQTMLSIGDFIVNVGASIIAFGTGTGGVGTYTLSSAPGDITAPTGMQTRSVISAADQAANPQWIGIPDPSQPPGTANVPTINYPVGTTWDYVALQEWLYACLACRSTPLSILWNITFSSYQLNVPGYCPAGIMTINQQLQGIATGASLEFASRRGSIITWIGNNLGTDPSQPAFLFNSLDYSQIHNLTLQDGGVLVPGSGRFGCQSALLSIDHNTGYATFAGGLSPQLNTFHDLFIGGYLNQTWACVGISLAGGAAQGDTQCFINMFMGGAQNGVVIGGDNAIGILFLGGNMTNCTRGISNIGAGSFTAINLLTEGDVYNYYQQPHADQLSMDGADFVSSEVSTENSLVIGNRSESMVFGLDTVGLFEVQNSAIAYAGSASWGANQHYPIGYVINTPGATTFTTAILADDGGPDWFLGTLDATSKIITVDPSSPLLPMTPNQYANYGIWLRYGSNGYCQSNAVVSNDATTLTLYNPYPAGLNYPLGYKLFLSGGPTQPNWAGVTTSQYGRTLRSGSGYQWSCTAGSNFIQGIAPPIGAWCLVCGAYLYNLQIATGSPAMLGGLYGKVAASYLAASFQGYITGTVMTVQSLTSNTIQIGALVNSAGVNVVSQLSGTPNGVGTYRVSSPVMYPLGASFWAHITTPGTLVVEQMYSGSLAQGQTLASVAFGNNTPTITAVPSHASFTASVDNGGGAAGNTMHVTAVASGSLAVGQTVTGPGVPANTTIVQSLTSGANGGPGDYALSGNPMGPIASTAMTSITTGIGSYTISDTTTTVGRIWMEAGTAGAVTSMATGQGFTIVDNANHPKLAGVSITNGQGYWGQPIVDGGLVWIPVDYDTIFGAKRLRGCQILGYGKVSHVGEMEFDGAVPQTFGTASYLRDTTVGLQPVNYRPAPDFALSVGPTTINASPYTLAVSQTQIGSTKTLYYNIAIAALTLNFPVLQNNLAMDQDIIFQAQTAGAVITWGSNVRAAAPTMTLGTAGQITVVRLKWWGTLASPAWIVERVQGPM